MPEYLTYREAASLIPRSRRTIRHWRQKGMPMTWEVRNGQRVRVVEKSVLQAWFRQRLKNNPAHQWKMRTEAEKAARNGEAP